MDNSQPQGSPHFGQQLQGYPQYPTTAPPNISQPHGSPILVQQLQGYPQYTTAAPLNYGQPHGSPLLGQQPHGYTTTAPPNYGYVNYQVGYAQPGGQAGQFPQHLQTPIVMMQQPMAVGMAGVKPIGPPPPDYLCVAIFSCIFCFWPTGIIAIIKSYQVRKTWMRGNYWLAMEYSQTARIWVIVTIVVGLIILVVNIYFVVEITKRNRNVIILN